MFLDWFFKTMKNTPVNAEKKSVGTNVNANDLDSNDISMKC